MLPLLDFWPSVSQQIRRASTILALFDYDGTLTPIVERPELARLDEATRSKLYQLSRCPKYRAGVISGRSLSDVAERVGVEGLIYAGNHGLEILGPLVEFLHPQARSFRNSLAEIDAELRQALEGLGGVIIEDKGLSLSVHFRLTPPAEWSRVEQGFHQVVAPRQESGVARITHGKMVLEVRPNLAWDKGKAILELKKIYPETGLVMFFGDDVTDEDGFAVIEATGGLSVFVGEAHQSSRASYRLESPNEVSQVLDLMIGLDCPESKSD